MEEHKNVSLMDEMLRKYQDYLKDEKGNLATIEKYMRDVRRFIKHLGDGELSRESMREYKQELEEAYKITSANSMLATVDSFLVLAGCGEWEVKLSKIQKVQYNRPEQEITRKEYERPVYTARRQEDEQISMLLQTIGSAGIRVSGLKFVTVESLKDRRAEIYSKRKCRVALLPEELTRLLKKYYKKAGIVAGSVFISRRRNPVDRSNMSKEMKQLGREVGMDTERIFPHNLRHLLARTFYSIEKDVIRLIGLLGYSSINTTRIYMMTMEEQPGRRMSRMRLVLG